jgi:hypothetical protein
MLGMMGWSEGDRIGVTGGIQDPLTAIIKITKLGLGAAKLRKNSFIDIFFLTVDQTVTISRFRFRSYYLPLQLSV